MDSKRQQIIDAIDARLKTIKTVNGYETDAGNNVFEWRATPLQDSELPALLFRDTTSPVDDETYSMHLHTLSVEITLVASGATSADIIRKMLADIQKAIGTDATWSGIAADTLLRTVDIGTVEHAEFKYTGGAINIAIQYLTERWNAYQ